jgi:hypothetical protein
MLYMDMKFGGRGKYAAWDEDPHTPTELVHFFKLFALQHSAPFATIVVWCESTQLGMVKDAMLASGFHSVQSIFWYKKDQQQNLGAHMLVPSVEVGLMAFLTGATQSNQYRHSINLPVNPFDRHNIIVGPGQRVYDRNADGKVINVCQKPAYLSEYFASRYLQPNSWVYVAGSGAGGDVMGFMNAGHNVLAMEKDAPQLKAMMANLRKYVPKSQLNKMVTVKELEDAKENPDGVPEFQFACGHCKALQEVPIADMCSFCSTQLCQTCRPTGGLGKCPVCDGDFSASGKDAPVVGDLAGAPTE